MASIEIMCVTTEIHVLVFEEVFQESSIKYATIDFCAMPLIKLRPYLIAWIFFGPHRFYRPCPLCNLLPSWNSSDSEAAVQLSDAPSVQYQFRHMYQLVPLVSLNPDRISMDLNALLKFVRFLSFQNINVFR